MTPPLFQIVGWGENFESGKSKHIDSCSHCYSPNKHSGLGFLNIMEGPEGAMVYGIWALIRELCSRQKKNVRDGWLTHDGRENGEPYTAEELSRMWRQKTEDVQLALRIVSQPRVGFLRHVSGEAAWLNTTHARPPHDPRTTPAGAVHDPRTTPEVEREKSGSVENEGVTSRPPHDPRTTPAGAVHDPRTTPLTRYNKIERESSRVCARAREGEGEAEEDLIQYAEAKMLISDLSLVAFNRKVREADWSNPEKDRWMDQAMPLERSKWVAIDWLYRLPETHEALQRTSRVQSFEGLLENLRREADKAELARKRMGLNGAGVKRSAAEKADEEREPEGWRDAHLALWGESSRMYKFFSEYPPSSQLEMRQFLEKKKAGVGT